MLLDLPEFKLEVYLGRWEFAAKHHLTASDAQSVTVGELLALGGGPARERFADLPLTYVPTRGSDELRAAVAATYERVSPEDVLCFAGAEEAMFWALSELVGPGDHAIVTVPNYQSIESVTVATGAQVSGLLLDPGQGWALDLGALERLLRPNTRLVAVNFPNNPTGALPPRDTFGDLVALCDAHGIRLFSDEVYRGIEVDPDATLPQAADLSETAVSLNVLSKAYGLPGLRIGWLASRDHALLDRLERRKHYTSICNAGPSEFLAALALRHGHALRDRNRRIVAANLPRLEGFFAGWPERFVWEAPRGGCVSFPRYTGADGVERFCAELVEQAGVVLLPASVFASGLADVPADRFRIGAGRLGLDEALTTLDGFLRSQLLGGRSRS